MRTLRNIRRNSGVRAVVEDGKERFYVNDKKWFTSEARALAWLSEHEGEAPASKPAREKTKAEKPPSEAVTMQRRLAALRKQRDELVVAARSRVKGAKAALADAEAQIADLERAFHAAGRAKAEERREKEAEGQLPADLLPTARHTAVSENRAYPSIEHAYTAAFLREDERRTLKTKTVGEARAKRVFKKDDEGNLYTRKKLPKGFDAEGTLYGILRNYFKQSELASALRATGGKKLVYMSREDVRDADKFGAIDGLFLGGRDNFYGEVLMQVREDIKGKGPTYRLNRSRR